MHPVVRVLRERAAGREDEHRVALVLEGGLPGRSGRRLGRRLPRHAEQAERLVDDVLS